MYFNVNIYVVASYFKTHIYVGGGSKILVKNLNFKERKDTAKILVEHTGEISCTDVNKYIILCIHI